MRDPRPQDVDPKYSRTTGPKPEKVDMSGVVAIKAKPRKETAKPKSPKSHQATVTPRNHDTTVSRYHDAIIESVRKAVKSFGKEAATHRFTAEEKQKIADIVYSYKRHGIRTSENEVTRIAINYVINDHSENGENSILDLTLKALNE